MYIHVYIYICMASVVGFEIQPFCFWDFWKILRNFRNNWWRHPFWHINSTCTEVDFFPSPIGVKHGWHPHLTLKQTQPVSAALSLVIRTHFIIQRIPSFHLPILSTQGSLNSPWIDRHAKLSYRALHKRRAFGSGVLYMNSLRHWDVFLFSSKSINDMKPFMSTIRLAHATLSSNPNADSQYILFSKRFLHVVYEHEFCWFFSAVPGASLLCCWLLLHLHEIMNKCQPTRSKFCTSMKHIFFSGNR